MRSSDPILDLLVAQARAGDQAALGRLLELYRNYLRLLARSLIRPPLQVQLDASDLVQETFLKAHREFAQFAGSGEKELVAWLRQILVRTLANQAKHHHARRRDQRRHESLDVLLDRSSLAIQQQLADSIASPSAHAVRREQAVLLADALARLPADYREVFILRNLEQVAVDEIAARMGRSPNAVRKLWGRAMVALKQAMEVGISWLHGVGGPVVSWSVESVVSGQWSVMGGRRKRRSKQELPIVLQLADRWPLTATVWVSKDEVLSSAPHATDRPPDSEVIGCRARKSFLERSMSLSRTALLPARRMIPRSCASWTLTSRRSRPGSRPTPTSCWPITRRWPASCGGTSRSCAWPAVWRRVPPPGPRCAMPSLERREG